MKRQVFWKNPGYKGYPELTNDIECDYLIVGGGMTGVSLAYFLSKQKAGKVVLIEKNTIASGATGKAAGTLVLRGEKDIGDIMKKHGRKKGLLYWQETSRTLNDLKRIIREEKIKCDAEPQDTLYCGFKHKSFNNIYEEFEIEKSIDSSAQLLKGDSLKKELNTEMFTHALLSRGHGISVNPLQLTQNLSLIAARNGTRIYEKTAMIRRSPSYVETHHGTVRFKKIILALDADHPAEEVKNLKSTIVVTRPLTEAECKKTGLNRKKIVFDAKENYDYFKLTRDNRLLVGFGGVGVHKKHKKTDPHYPHLAKIQLFVKSLFPYLSLNVDYAWSGTFGVTDDYDPLVEQKGNFYSISGAGTQVICMLAARYVAEKLSGKKSTLDLFFQN